MNEQSESETSMDAGGVDVTSLEEVLAIKKKAQSMIDKADAWEEICASEVATLSLDCASCPMDKSAYSAESLACAGCSTGSRITMNHDSIGAVGKAKATAQTILGLL